MIKHNPFLQLDALHRSEMGNPKGIDPGKPWLTFADGISKKYRARRRFTKFPLYFLRTGVAGEAIIVNTIFNYQPIVRYYPRLNLQWGIGKKIGDRLTRDFFRILSDTLSTSMSDTLTGTIPNRLSNKLPGPSAQPSPQRRDGLTGLSVFPALLSTDNIKPLLQLIKRLLRGVAGNRVRITQTIQLLLKSAKAMETGEYRSRLLLPDAMGALQLTKTPGEFDKRYDKRIAAGYTFLEDSLKYIYPETETLPILSTEKFIDPYAGQFIEQYTGRYANIYTAGRSMYIQEGPGIFESRLTQYFRQYSGKPLLPRYTSETELPYTGRRDLPELRVPLGHHRGVSRYGTLLKLTDRMLRSSVDYISQAYTRMTVKGKTYTVPIALPKDGLTEPGEPAVVAFPKSSASGWKRLLESVTVSFARLKEKLFNRSGRSPKEKPRQEEQQVWSTLELPQPERRTTDTAATRFTSYYSSVLRQTRRMMRGPAVAANSDVLTDGVTDASREFREWEENRFDAHLAYITREKPVFPSLLGVTSGWSSRITVKPDISPSITSGATTAISTALTSSFKTALTATGDLLKNTREQIIARKKQPHLYRRIPPDVTAQAGQILPQISPEEEWMEIAENIRNRFTDGYDTLNRLTGKLIKTTSDNIAAASVRIGRDDWELFFKSKPESKPVPFKIDSYDDYDYVEYGLPYIGYLIRKPSLKSKGTAQYARQLFTRFTAYYASALTAANDVLQITTENVAEHFKRRLRQIRPRHLTRRSAEELPEYLSWLSFAAQTALPGEFIEPSIKTTLMHEINHRTSDPLRQSGNRDRIGAFNRLKEILNVEFDETATDDAGNHFTRYITNTAHVQRLVFKNRSQGTGNRKKYVIENQWRQFFAAKYTYAEETSAGTLSTLSTLSNMATSISSHIKSNIFKYVSERFTTTRDTEGGEETLKQRVRRTQTEALAEAEKQAAAQRAALPQLPGFDKVSLEKKYTSKLSSYPHHLEEDNSLSFESFQFGLPQNHWLSIGPKALNQKQELPPLEQFWKDAREKSVPTDNEPLSLDMLTQKTSPSAPTSRRASHYPGMTHRPPETHGLDESALKKIEKKIADETKQFKTTMEKNIASTNAAIPKANLNQMADDVYNIILDKVKKERKMRGL